MAKTKNRPKSPTAPTPFEEARDELFQHVMRCDVVGATTEHQEEWFSATMGYLSERYHELSAEQIEELKKLGMRFVQPPKRREEADTASAA